MAWPRRWALWPAAPLLSASAPQRLGARLRGSEAPRPLGSRLLGSSLASKAPRRLRAEPPERLGSAPPRRLGCALGASTPRLQRPSALSPSVPGLLGSSASRLLGLRAPTRLNPWAPWPLGFSAPRLPGPKPSSSACAKKSHCMLSPRQGIEPGFPRDGRKY